MISKTIGFRGLAYFQTHPYNITNYNKNSNNNDNENDNDKHSRNNNNANVAYVYIYIYIYIYINMATEKQNRKVTYHTLSLL